jgi:ABC-type nitrate/sulfonate/bicarbonate transport system permease component
MIVTMGILSIIPIFLIVFIPALIGYLNGIKAMRQKILNAIEVWKDDLGPDYVELQRQAQE